jgi:hypothetical protein
MLYPYRVEFSDQAHADLTICKGASSESHNPSIRIPTPNDKSALESEPHNTAQVELPFDLVEASSSRIEMALNPRIALQYVLATHFPFQYNRLPSVLRDLFLRSRRVDTGLTQHLGIENFRRIFLDAVNELGFSLQRRSPTSLIITHDVDTEKGLQRALPLKNMEDQLGISSTWFLLSEEYNLPQRLVEDLAQNTTIGSHDIRHDGRLIQVKRIEELVRRLSRSRLKLETIVGKPVKCFRSPLLQFNGRILSALREAGYESDFSAPCWEPVHPSTMSGFGTESVQPFEFEGIVEHPLTLFQDHQVLQVLRMSTREAIKLWIDQARLVRSLDGDIVLLVHPDYGFSQDLDAYRQLLASLMEIQHSYEADDLPHGEEL